jgi:hypothetical protein
MASTLVISAVLLDHAQSASFEAFCVERKAEETFRFVQDVTVFKR